MFLCFKLKYITSVQGFLTKGAEADYFTAPEVVRGSMQ